MPISTLIVDDHQLVLDGISLMLEEQDDILVVAQAHDGQEAIDYVEKAAVDVVLMDLNMPSVNGIEACTKIKTLRPEVKVLILSMISDGKMVQRLIKAGANGYMLKNSGQDEVIQAIHEVYQGIDHFDKRLLEMMLNPTIDADKKEKSLFPALSRREKEILQLIINEHTTGEIAAQLFISFGTVESHRRNMISKLGVRNTAGLVSAAYRYELL